MKQYKIQNRNQNNSHSCVPLSVAKDIGVYEVEENLLVPLLTALFFGWTIPLCRVISEGLGVLYQ